MLFCGSLYIRGIYYGSCLVLGSLGLRHDLPLHAAIHGYDLAAVITDVKALRTEDCGRLTKKRLHEGWGWMGMASSHIIYIHYIYIYIYVPGFRNIPGYINHHKSTNHGFF